MLRTLIVGITFVGLISVALVVGVPRQVGISSVTVLGASTECDSSSDPCLRVYKNLKDVENQSYKVVKFNEGDVTRALIDDVRRIHNKIKDETGFDCKKGRYEYGYYRCEEGAIATQYPQLIQALEMLYN